MTIKSFLEKLTNPEKYGPADTVVIDVSPELYLKQMAVYTAVGIIANAISQCEFLCYENGKKVKNEDYYVLNISPNENQTASQFWHKVIEEMLATPHNAGEALVIEMNKKLYCADSFALDQRRPILGNVYSGVTIDSLTLDKKFYAQDVYLMKLSNQSAIDLINGMYSEYEDMLKTAAGKIKRANGRKYKLHITGVKTGDEKFASDFENVIKKQLKAYMENDSAIYPEFDGYSLEPETNQQTADPEDFTKLRADMFKMVGDVFKIPDALMTGNITNMKDIMDEFLTIAVDPYAKMIEQAMNKRAKFENWADGNYYKVKTSSIYHRDPVTQAVNIEKLIESGFADIDETREEFNWDSCDTDWSRQHWLTKNFGKIEDVLKNAEGGDR